MAEPGISGYQIILDMLRTIRQWIAGREWDPLTIQEAFELCDELDSIIRDNEET